MQPREHSNDTNIVIIGFMGVGKTTIGSLLAQKLNREFFDVDKLIEMEFGRTIPEIFELWGEQSFREKERDIILTLCRQRNKVIALGGGAFIQEDIRNYCLKHCSVFLLDLSWEEWKTNRLTSIIDTRPLLQNITLTEMHQLFHHRKTLYRHHWKFNIDKLSPHEASDYIIGSLPMKMPRDGSHHA